MLNLAVITMFIVVMTPPPPRVLSDAYPIAELPRTVPAISGTPERIVISSVDINLPVGVGSYDGATGDWTLSDTSAYYADISVPANDSNGVTLIYGHDRIPIFGRLLGLQPGADADVYTMHHVFHYKYQSVTHISPTDMSIFRTSGPPTLVLQTCTGAWDAYRAMYSFRYVSEATA